MNTNNTINEDITNLQADCTEIISAYVLRKKERFIELLKKGTSVTIKFDWHDILKTFKIDSATQPKCGTLRELIELTNDKEYLELINDENYLKLLEEKDKLYRLDIDLPF